ncbi:DUF2804 domain-containing protein [Dietzia sp. 179-F 9C3 NHS]|uniref:DUF2804 domain-containing protein n=1 Tax=Dietzia sp. 179-F 9C3 NHS TaxID=3374295 RepID=UPI00387918C4
MEHPRPGAEFAHTEHEITEPVDLAHGARLNPAAVGWSRIPLHRTAISGWGRTKRWEYWGIVTDRWVIGLTVAGLDYLALAGLYVFDRATGEEIARDGVAPAGHPRLGDAPGDGSAWLAAGLGGGTVTVGVEDRPGLTSLHAEGRGIAVEAEVRRPAHDALAVVVPWSARHFQYTLKDLANPVTGSITINGTTHDIGRGWAVLDRGRGRWRWANIWNWGAGSGVVDGSTRAIQVGGRWTDGTGCTENGLLVDGRMHKIGEDLTWDYDLSDAGARWHVRGERIDAVLTPFHRRRAITELGVLAVRTHQAFGEWHGTGILDDGREVSLDGLVGWAEESRNRW